MIREIICLYLPLDKWLDATCTTNLLFGETLTTIQSRILNDVHDESAKIVICLFNVNLRLYIIRERKKEGGKSNAVTQKWKTIKNHYKHILIVMEVSWSRNRAVDILVYNNNSLTITYIFCFYISVEKVVGMTWLSGSCMTDQKMSADQKLIYCNDSWVVSTIPAAVLYLLLPKSSSTWICTQSVQWSIIPCCCSYIATYNTDAGLGIARLAGQMKSRN